MELGGQFLFSDHDSTKVAVYCRHQAAAELWAVGVVEATCEAIIGLVMSMDLTRYE